MSPHPVSTVCLTGATDGIGLATARVLLAAGHRVLVHARSPERGRPVLEALQAEPGPTGEAVLVTGDLAQLDEVRALADQVRAAGPIDVLVHNAGVWVRGDVPRVTADGLETTFVVNVLAPHLLTTLLLDAGSGPPAPARGWSARAGRCCTPIEAGGADLGSARYWKGRRPIPLPRRLRDAWLCLAVADACDDLLRQRGVG